MFVRGSPPNQPAHLKRQLARSPNVSDGDRARVTLGFAKRHLARINRQLARTAQLDRLDEVRAARRLQGAHEQRRGHARLGGDLDGHLLHQVARPADAGLPPPPAQATMVQATRRADDQRDRIATIVA
jgi:hypothetical protein